MALVLTNQKVYLSKVEVHERDTKNGKRRYTKGMSTFISSSKVNKDEYVKDEPFFVNYVCFSKEANTLINSELMEKDAKGLLLEVSGKIFTRSYEKDGKKSSYNEFVIYTAKLPVRKPAASTQEKVEEQEVVTF